MGLDEKIKKDEVLARYTTYQIGGMADYFLEASSTEEVLEALAWAEDRDMPVFVFGGGSNLLFDDAGFRGLVIRMRAQALKVRGEELWAEAGAMSARLVKAAAESALTGLEEWNGLPGTVGGAVLGNAGCFGVEVKDVLKEATVYLPGQGVKTLGVDEMNYAYRWSRFKKENGVILSATFRLHPGNAEAIQEKMKAVARTRIQKQPPGLNTGSFFKILRGTMRGA
ncbi:UDP-N-acetylmuramate dehydrogenase [Candidatus Peregrinibacteria bacterium]|nr:MAG: UDP-N-acetylmuramate dehydrogenase [Candidatus Peregrinibacteria bacterium]